MLGVSDTFFVCFVLLFKEHSLIMAQIVQLRFIPAAAVINIWRFKKNPFFNNPGYLGSEMFIKIIFLKPRFHEINLWQRNILGTN